MRIVCINGNSAQLTTREVRAFFSHPLYVLMMFVLCGSIVLMAPYDHLLNFDVLRKAIFYANCFSSFMVAILVVYKICDVMGWVARSTVVVLIGGVFSSLWGTVAALVLGAPTPPISEIALLTGFNVVFCLLGDLIVSTFLFNRIVKDIVAARPLPGDREVPERTDELPSHVRLFGQVFPLAELRLLQAEEHYVRVTLADGSSHLLRGRMGDAEAVLPLNFGLRIHRSHWVAAAALEAFRQDRGEAFVLTKTGKKLAVARHRIPEVRVWAQGVIAHQNKGGRKTTPPITVDI